MHSPVYRTIIREALTFSLKKRYLWFFGLFAALLGNGGEYEILLRLFQNSFNGSLIDILSVFSGGGVFSTAFIKKIFSSFAADPFSGFLLFFLIVLFLVALVFLVWLISVSQAAIVYAIAHSSQKETHTLSYGFRIGRKYFFSILGLNVIYFLSFSLALTIIGLPVYLYSTFLEAQGGLGIYLLTFFVFVPFAIIVSFVAKYALSYIVLHDYKLIDALWHGWNLFLTNWLVSLEMAMSLFLFNLFFGLIGIIVLIFVATPFFIVSSVFISIGSGIGTFSVLVLGIIVAFIVLAFIGMFLATFQYSAWTMLFLRFKERGVLSKLIRIFHAR